MVRPFRFLQNLQARRLPTHDVTLADFSGGIKDVDNETGLPNNFAAKCVNMLRHPDNSMSVRFGRKLTHVAPANIIDIVDYNGQEVIFCANGHIFRRPNKTDPLVAIWNPTIAGALPGNPAGWAATQTRIDTTIFNGELIAVNGQDKPLLIKKDFTVTYLQDLASGTNIHTPISRFVTTVSNFCVMAGVTNSLEIYISNTGTSGTWPDDAPPNNATVYNLGAAVSADTSQFQGLSAFHDNLVVFFSEAIVVLQLGIFDEDGVHTPQVVDTFINVGLTSHKALLEKETLILFLDKRGLYKLMRNMFTNRFEVKLLSNDLGKRLLGALANICNLCSNSLIVEDPQEPRIYIHIRIGQTGEWRVYEALHNDQYNRFSWGRMDNVPFTMAVTNGRRQIVYAHGTDIYLQGNSLLEGEEFHDDAGEPIPFEYETGWLDAQQRMKSKKLLRTLIDAFGTAAFTLQIFVDLRYKDKETGTLVPVVQMQFRGSEAAGYGEDAGPYGGGRRVGNSFFAMPTRFRLMKIRIVGETMEPLTIAALSLIFRQGEYHR